MFASARKTILGLVLVASLVFAVSATQAAPTCVVGVTTTCTFSYTGAPEAWVVPAGVTSAVFEVHGAQGGNLAAIGDLCCNGILAGNTRVTPAENQRESRSPCEARKGGSAARKGTSRS